MKLSDAIGNVKDYLRVVDDTDNTLITAIMAAAKQTVLSYTGLTAAQADDYEDLTIAYLIICSSCTTTAPTRCRTTGLIPLRRLSLICITAITFKAGVMIMVNAANLTQYITFQTQVNDVWTDFKSAYAYITGLRNSEFWVAYAGGLADEYINISVRFG